ncbi:TPA: phage tail family protein [Staphylococcus pseudintermedius]|uniref:distal tail protein Dit n=1 Tax=Staphylococcus pseudintermedius TaxID=283734 RepID=UPI0018F57E91|nr:distal tail protein Dit [Staphylococcus pseudintermedius]EGQ2753925.1 phage tail protein [Staphylococcus pseudintermedius]EGQ4313028.1 phage tail protein [Staphylococcus pseudintermedius]EII2697921.1 phage tail family protein [Staphylococcus pseudintermedius]EKH7752796.1 phage tail family protein [Staphylococcus pseudintermedius]ELD8084913.1 phage tail family protein [Staphylococcus pseudintermedius]
MNFRFNGKTNPHCDYMDYQTFYGIDRDVQYNEVLGRPGGVLSHIKESVRTIEVNLLIDAYGTGRTLEDIVDEVVSWLTTNEPVPLIFDREPDKIYYAMTTGGLDPSYFVTFAKVKANFVCLDPYKYAVDGNQNTAISDAVSVVNSGTADTPVIVEARALQNSNYYMISKGDEDYFMIGDDDLDKPLKDYSPLILEDESQTLSGWNKQSTIDFTDNQTGGKVGGSFIVSDSKQSFYLNNDSVSGNGWNGAMYKRSFSKQAQDFTTTVKFGINQKNKGAVRFAQYIYDSDNRVIASIGYTNPNAKQAIGTIIVTLFDQSGNQQTVYKYKNNPSLYKLDSFVVYIRLTRKDDVFTVKSWKYKEFPYPLRKKAFDEHERQFVDGGNFYQRPVVALSLYSAKNGSNNVMPLYIFGTYTRELLPRPTNARDMIIKKGDLITIDMATKNVLVNEESFLSEKTFGSNYFNVDKGHTELVINPPGIFDTTVKWQDRYL